MEANAFQCGLSMHGVNVAQKRARFTYADYWMDYYLRLKELAVNEFEWKYLPDTCNEPILELTLYEMGYAIFFQEPVLGTYLNAMALLKDKYNMYYIPPKREAYAVTGQRWNLDYTNSVLIFNNRLRTPTDFVIRNYASELANIRQSIGINVRKMRTPYILKGNPTQVKEMRLRYRKIEDGEEAIMEDEFNEGNPTIEVLNLNPPEYYEKLEMQFSKVWRNALTFVGVNNSPTDKKERLVEDEVSANNEEILSQRAVRLTARREAAEKINQLFGLNIEVVVRERRLSDLGGIGGLEGLMIDDIGGDDNGSVHNDTNRRDGSSDRKE